ncbi:hypothetical protein [Kribbella sindirgiensis]|uniref:Abi family protein n=1 Tax=Kribbella sindirgiensis TaxID=1124744 RepID=A0A4R0IIU7_9ACTN|nr:hypothetical protein [Kribbella sindirgiensis]TCC33343.1 hypothetical protein E0H50_15235 [Kribbella sindirgiensis]
MQRHTASRSRPWTLENLLSEARLGPYLAATDGSLTSALRLYDWNTQASSAFHEELHYVEVGLRNAMDRQLAAWAKGLGAQSSWYADSRVPLTPRTRRKVADARNNATRGGRPELHGKVVAELMLGFWWSLLSDEYNRRLWQPCLQYAFDGPVRRTRLHSELDELRRLRNRIAHHEPIHGRDLLADHQRVLDVARRISPRLSERVEAVSRVPKLLVERPATLCT